MAAALSSRETVVHLSLVEVEEPQRWVRHLNQSAKLLAPAVAAVTAFSETAETAPSVSLSWNISVWRALTFWLLTISCAQAQAIGSSYSTRDGRAGTVVIACPSQDGSYTAQVCTLSRPIAVNYAAPASGAVAIANAAVTVFSAGSVQTGCDIVNTGSATLYVDLTTTAVAGSPTSIPLQPNQAFHCPYPPTNAVTAVAAQAQSFVAIRY